MGVYRFELLAKDGKGRPRDQGFDLQVVRLRYVLFVKGTDRNDKTVRWCHRCREGWTIGLPTFAWLPGVRQLFIVNQPFKHPAMPYSDLLCSDDFITLMIIGIALIHDTSETRLSWLAPMLTGNLALQSARQPTPRLRQSRAPKPNNLPMYTYSILAASVASRSFED
jgi:hypothetical protein